MPEFIAWCGFLGAWLLVAGPVYQAALELREEDMTRLHDLRDTAAVWQKPPVSRWWWLLPPVHYILQQRRSRADRDAWVSSLTPEEFSAVVSFLHKATGWWLVGLGGLFLATKETWELCEHYEWSAAVFWPVEVVTFIIALSSTVALLKRGEDDVARRSAM